MLQALRRGRASEGAWRRRRLQADATRGWAISRITASPLLAGVFLSAGNRYFIIWWLTVGAGLVLKSVEFGPIGSCSSPSFTGPVTSAGTGSCQRSQLGGSKALGPRFQWGVQLICGVFLVFMAGWFGSMVCRLSSEGRWPAPNG